MKFWLLSDNHDTVMGMRLAGIEGEIVSSGEQALRRVEEIEQDPDIGILLVTAGVYQSCRGRLDEIRLKKETPLVVEIPDRHDEGGSGSSITDYIRDAIGVKI